jgi:hypothetical protein
MEHGKRGRLVQSSPFHMLTNRKNHGDAWEQHVLQRQKGSVKHAVTRISVKWTGAREYLL